MAQKRKKNGDSAIKQYKKRKKRNVLSLFLTILTFAFVSAMVILEIIPDTYSIEVGEAAKETIYSIAETEDTEATEREREKARASVADIYVINEGVSNTLANYFENTVFKGFSTVASYGYGVRGENEDDGGYQIAYDTLKVSSFAEKELSFLKDSPNDKSVEAKVKQIMDADPAEVKALKEWFMPRFKATLSSGITDEELENTKAELSDSVMAYGDVADTELKSILAETLNKKLESNSVLDEEATNKARDNAANGVATVYIAKGTEIVTKDEIVTQAQYDMLNKMGMLKEGGIPIRLLAGSVGLVLLLTLAAAWYILLFEKKTWHRPRKVLLLCLLSIADILISLVFKSAGWEMMMNTAMCVSLIAIFYDEQLALVMNTVLSVLLAMIVSGKDDLFGMDAIALMISAYTGGTAAVYVCKFVRVAARVKMLLPGATAGVVSMFSNFIVLSLAGKSTDYCIVSALYSLAGGIVAALFSTGSLAIWESIFNLLTPSKLLELSNTELLRKMSVEVPGTYQHSATVAELAENAAKDIGANALFARTASLYHDIGKIRVPECYTENQTAESKNFHSALSPRESTDMIFSHISEGVQIAKENKLPKEIINVIRQHHGTSAVMYFYNKAKSADPDTNIEDFRYAGPNPQTKEAAIILLADCVEASVRSMDDKSAEAVQAQIERMFKARMEDGELDDCELSLKDISMIKNSFASTLAAIYHTRIKYDNGRKKQ